MLLLIFILIPMIDSFLYAIQHPFFIRSVIIVALIACIFPLYGNLILMRKEANIAHTFAHIALLWVAVWLWFNRSIDLSILCSVLVTVVFLYFLWIDDSKNIVTHNEIGAQFGLVWAILLVSQMTGYRADITSYLFGDILLLWRQDIILTGTLVGVCGILYALFWRKRYAVSLHTDLAKSTWIHTTSSQLFYLVALWILIGGAMKIIGVLLVSAFLILPSSISKVFASTKLQRNIWWVIVCTFLSIIALFLAWHFDMPSWASIVWVLIVVFFILQITKKVL
jgi:zinc transport system permease protein